MSEIVAIEDATIPTGRARGNKTDRVKEVLFLDGTTAYRCPTCGKDFASFLSALGHLSAHGKRVGEPVKVDPVAKAVAVLRTAADTRLARENRALLRKVKRLEERLREEQRARRKAERNIEALREVLGPLS